MSRSIKFRAWDKEQKRMLCPVWIGKSSISWERGVSVLTNEYIPMQFTGLCDKNGREIFEGDIVTDGASPRIVEWFDLATGFWPFIDEYFGGSKCTRVIGNIHENPELLK